MESTLNMILMLMVLAVMDTLNAISPYLTFAVLVITLLVGLTTLVYTTTGLRIIDIIRKWRKKGG